MFLVLSYSQRVLSLDPCSSMLVYMLFVLIYMLYALCHVFLCFVPLFFYVDVRVTCSHACMMLLAMPCSDLCVDVCIFMLYGQILIFTCLYAWIQVLPCLCARLVHVDVYVSMPTCLDLCFHMLYTIFHVLVRSMPCLCTQTQAMFVMPCAIVALLFLLSHFFMFWPNGQDPIQTLWSLSSPIHQSPHQKSSDHSYLHVYACLLLCFMLVLAFLVLGFAMLGTLRRLDLLWLHPTPMRPCSDVTI